jgi:hypothetical protein
MIEKLTHFSRNVGPMTAGSSLIVRRDGIEYRGKHLLEVAGHDLGGVHRSVRWVGIDYDAGGEVKHAWFGCGLAADTETLDRIEYSLAAVMRLNARDGRTP